MHYMNKNLQSPTKLTEFAPIQTTEEKPTSVGQFVANLFKLNRGAPSSPLEEATAVETDVQESLPSWAADASASEYDVNEGRSLPNVLKRISNLVALKSTSLQDYAETELKQYWMPDSVSNECYECCGKFTTFRRRHHCRVCGQIFCSQCCNEQISGKIFGCTGDLRVCNYCSKVVASYFKTENGVISLVPESPEEETFAEARRKISVGYQEENFGASTPYLTAEEKCTALQNSVSLRNLFEELTRSPGGLPLASHKYRLLTYIDCFLGSDLVDWLICQQKANTRVQASAIGQALFEGGYIECVAEPFTFVDGYALYKLGDLDHFGFTNILEEEPLWIQHEQGMEGRGALTSSSSYTLDLNLQANSVYLSKPAQVPRSYSSKTEPEENTVQPSEQREFAPEDGWHQATFLREEHNEKLVYEQLSDAYAQHELTLLKQLLATQQLSLTWTETILPLSRQIIDVIRPDKNHDARDLDIRHYLKFKKLPSSTRSDTEFVRGLVCTKNISHRAMSREILNPKILLLQCPVVYQRTEGRLMSLEPVLMQEHEYLRHVVTRIAAFQPDVLLVQKTVSRLAQELLLEQGITLVYNVKPSVLTQLARCMDADLVQTLDAHIGRPRLGSCARFHLKRFNIGASSHKTLMFFEGLPLGHLGGTVLLRGGARRELERVETVLGFFLFAAYNWRLEKSFLMEEFAQPPSCELELDEAQGATPKLLVRPTQSRKSNVEAVVALTDPLQAPGPVLGELEEAALAVEEPASSFRQCLIDTTLDISPLVAFPIPYLETDLGRRCKLRSFFPVEVYTSTQLQGPKSIKPSKETAEAVVPTPIPSLHPLLTQQITSELDESLVAEFRACGGSLTKRAFLIPKPVEPREKDTFNKSDVFEIRNHQRLSVLFCSYSHESQNSPAFCVNPWVFNMSFYGANDIPLGCFLERYCFRGSYACPSQTCGAPMLKHTRRFVHNGGCVSITLNNFQSAYSDEDIVMWSWCTKCQTVSPVVKMSRDTWSFSLAKYLELRFYGGLYTRRGTTPCTHSLHHDHYQYFGYKSLVASFAYSPVPVWEVSLPVQLIQIQGAYRQEELVDEVRAMTVKGHEVYAGIKEKLAGVGGNVELEGLGDLRQLLVMEQSQFKDKVEVVQVRLTSPTLWDRAEEVWRVSDALTRLKRGIVEAVEVWNARLSETVRRKDQVASPSESSAFGASKSLDQSDDGEEPDVLKGHTRSQSDGTDVDQADAAKKTVKNILSQLLPSASPLALMPNPFNVQEHYTLPTGVFVPIVVYESEPSSIIAYALNSYDYKRAFEELEARKGASTPSPVTKRKLHQSTDSSGGEAGAEDPKKPHIEVQFQDASCNFFCRIYFAQAFAKLRAQVLPSGEEAYIRSLARSVQWNARGGKSGSKFAKTADDRFILKEMSKSEVQLFLESAPNYFTYMQKCFSSGQPTLLGKIVGVYQVLFKNASNVTTLRSNVLVMENLFYNRTVVQKFDLKGSMRNRLVIPDDNLAEEVVLLDENLLKMTCDAPLYILTHSKVVLAAAIQNDTDFLSAQSVMDYSLLVGLDSENNELVLGIIDYIRTFTWDKKLETMVKKSGILGGQGKLPTIVSPEEYQKRFIDAMHRYFLEVPDHWAGLGKGLEF